MGRTITPVGDSFAVAAGARSIAVPSDMLPERGIIGFLVAIDGTGNDLTDVDRLRAKVNSKPKFDVLMTHNRKIIQRWSDSNLVPADADTIFSFWLNLGPAGRLDDRFQLAPGKCTFELASLSTWAAGNYRIYVVTTDEAPLAYIEAIGEGLNYSASTGPKTYTPAKEGLCHGYVINTTGLARLNVYNGQGVRRAGLDTDSPSPLLEVERTEDGAAAAGLNPRAFLLRGPEPASTIKFEFTLGATWAGVANEQTTIRQVPA